MRKSLRYFRKNEKGQLGLFFAISLLIVATIIAFLINVGLYVKAKINLQNAADAAAWSGAAVQARQLSDIAYLNYEMRSNYKEWLFKIYVLGQTSQKHVRNIIGLPFPASNGLNNSYTPPPDNMDFRNVPILDIGQLEGEVPRDPENNKYIDRFNIPSVCFNVATGNDPSKDLCPYAHMISIEGYEPAGLGVLDEAISNAMVSLTEQTGKTCNILSKVNESTLLHWTFGTQATSENSRIPALLPERIGAWIKGLELALRIRNLEKIVNAPPSETCSSGCANTITAIESSSHPDNERIVKAYLAARKNLGGGTGLAMSEMKNELKITEIPPFRVNLGGTETISNSFMRGTYQKYYLDLLGYTVNYAVPYTKFIPNADPDKKVWGACTISKVALPAINFPLAFAKNPDLLTYYAVRAETHFVGLFNPFNLGSGGRGTKLIAYSAAKPFGGRIGPRILKGKTSDTFLTARSDGPSFPNFLSFEPQTPSEKTTFDFGDVIPYTSDFWASSNPSQPIGGTVSSQEIRFVIPNLFYEFLQETRINDHRGDSSEIIELVNYVPISSRTNALYPPSQEIGGLYDPSQFRAFATKNLPQLGNGNVTPELLRQAVANVRRPTLYDSVNYMIPTLQHENYEATGAGIEKNSDGHPMMQIYAPLYGPNLLFQNLGEVMDYIGTQYFRNATPAIETYLKSVQKAANGIVVNAPVLAANTGAPSTLVDALENVAQEIHDTPGGAFNDVTCKSTAGSFAKFYLGDLIGSIPLDSDCISPSLIKNVEDHLSQPGTFQYTYAADLYYPGPSELRAAQTLDQVNLPQTDSLYNSYSPGPFHNVSNGISASSALPGTEDGNKNHRRSFYSTKFVAVGDLVQNSVYMSDQWPPHSEGEPPNSTNIPGSAQNYLDLSGLPENPLEFINH